jgi:uncharacterized glyoxalase superfamily protein PhnB
MRQTVTPYLLYEDAGAALEWLAEAFGFREIDRIEGENGAVGHAEMDVGDGSSVFLGSPSSGYQGPKRLGTRTALVYAYVPNVDAHHARAKQAGAEIVEDPADQPYGDRRYAAADLEGQHWYFAQRLNG